MIMGVAFFGPIYPTIPHMVTTLLKVFSEPYLAFRDICLTQIHNSVDR
jgi:hypothetical protein